MNYLAISSNLNLAARIFSKTTTTMKRLYIVIAVIAAVLGLTSCQRSGIEENNITSRQLNFFVDLNEDTRILFEDGLYSWQGDGEEVLGVYIASKLPTVNAPAVVALQDGRGFCSTTTKDFAKGDNMFVYFPHSGANDAKSISSVSLTIPQAQSQSKADIFDVNNMPMVGYPVALGSELGTSVTMRPMASLLQAKVYASGSYAGEKLLSVSYTTSAGVAGEFTADLAKVGTDAGLTLTGGKASSVTTTLATPYAVGASKTDAKAIYMVLAPGDYQGTVEVTTDKAIYTYNYNKQVVRNTYYDLYIDLQNAASRREISGQWGGGDGSAANPYLIATAADLKLLSTRINDASQCATYTDKHYRQVANIDMSAVTIAPIGSYVDNTNYTATKIALDIATQPFKGVYDGGNYTISGLKIDNTATAACGLFGCTEGATLKNITIKNSQITSSHLNVGALVGMAIDTKFEAINVDASVNGTAKSVFIEPADSKDYESSVVGGVAGYVSGCTMDNVTFSGAAKSTSQHCGGIVAYAAGTKFNKCTLAKGATVDAGSHFCGGIAARARFVSTFDNCVIDGCVSNYTDNYTGGITAHLTSGYAKNCLISQSACISSRGDHTGGIVGALQPFETLNADKSNQTAHVIDCINYAFIPGEDNVGGIVGYQGNSDADRTCNVINCVSYGDVHSYVTTAGGVVGIISSVGTANIINCKAYGNVTCSLYNVGGIVGSVTSKVETTIDNCIAYGKLVGQYSVGGIVGFAMPNDAACMFNIINSVYAGRRIEARGNNGNNGYTLAAGIAGWVQVTAGTLNIINCASRVEEIHTLSTAAGYKSKNNAMAGIIGFQNGTTANIKGATIHGVYSTIKWNGFHTDGISYATHTSPSTLAAGIGSRIYNASVDYAYFDQSAKSFNPSAKNNTPVLGKNIAAITTTDALLANMNAAVDAYEGSCTYTLKKWVTDADGYPVIEGMATNLATPTTQKRISVIGDSISTFRGIVPNGYSCHYPTADGDLTSMSQTYWWILANELMLDATIERNISYSGSCVSFAQGVDQPHYTKRFIDNQGVGEPEIVIIHGGTNDWAKNKATLYGNVSMQATSGPSDATLAQLFSTAEAATTRAAIEALDDTTFCTAYIKLIELILERRADTKIVCIVGDYTGVGVQQSIHKIAAHYPQNARVVDLLAVNGFNDQVYMPKHDYNPETGKGCHPSAKAMVFMANKIYDELGAWLEE